MMRCTIHVIAVLLLAVQSACQHSQEELAEIGAVLQDESKLLGPDKLNWKSTNPSVKVFTNQLEPGMFGAGPADPDWTPERIQMHDELLERSMADAMALHDQALANAGPPTIYCMRGNTACGKSRAIKMGLIPELKAVSAMKGPFQAINPDAFKAELLRIDKASAHPHGFTSVDVHEEGSWLAETQFHRLLNKTDAQGTLVSILIDKRLGAYDSVLRYQKAALLSGRRFHVYDVDCPLKTSLSGVLERTQTGEDPIPPFVAIAEGGYVPSQVNRPQIVRLIVNETKHMGKYMLMGTDATNAHFTIAINEDGNWTYKDAKNYDEAIARAATAETEVRETALDIIDQEEVLEECEQIAEPFEAVCESAVGAWKGWSWKNASDAWASGIGPDGKKWKPETKELSGASRASISVSLVSALSLVLVMGAAW